MEEGAFTEPAAALLEAARAAGFGYRSESTLNRRRRAGLLPANRRIGNHRFYPAGATRQFLALLTIERDEVPASLARVGWRAWWFGWPVSERYWHPVLIDAAVFWDRTIPRINRAVFDKSYEVKDNAFELIEKLKKDRNRLPLFRQLRKRLTHYFDFFLITTFRIAMGRFTPFPALNDGDAIASDVAKDAFILDRGLGLDTARKHRLPGIRSWLSGDISKVLARLSLSLRGVSLRELLANSSTEEIQQSRDQLIFILFQLAKSYAVLKNKRGIHAFGFGVITKYVRIGRPRIEALFLLLFHAAKRDPQFSADVDSFVAKISTKLG